MLLGEGAASAEMWPFECVLQFTSTCQRCFPVGIQVWEELLSASEHFEPLQSIVYSHFMDKPYHYAHVLALESFRGGFASCSMAKAINQGWTYRVVSHVPPQACCVTVSWSLFCPVLFPSLLRWRQQDFCTSQWEHPSFSQHILFASLWILSGQNLGILIHFPALVTGAVAAGPAVLLEVWQSCTCRWLPSMLDTSCVHTMHLLGVKSVLYKTHYTM